MAEKTPSEQLVAEIPHLRAFARALAGSTATADDLVQETLVKAWTNFTSFQQGTNLRAWLITIMRNSFYDMHRKYGRELQDSEGQYAAQVATRGNQEGNLALVEFRAVLDQLAPDHREVLIMIGINELSYEQAADICGVAVGTIKSRVNRARAKLAEILHLTEVNDIGPDPLSSSVLAAPPTKTASR
ncbi:MAG: sigma-70 family RNA polymerase sigma factor [Xanthobacteraceae bacterium]|nr:MAG: sigma-70 family RNA polymerase sigma factor [Xanthobacteraceae bacterium]